MAYKVIILYQLYMPSYFLGTFTEYPYIITSVSASDMCTYLKGGNEYVNFEEKYPKQIQRMREEFSGIQEDSNPCIVIYSF